MNFLLFWFTLLSISFSQDAPCADDPTFYRGDDQKKTCDWVGAEEARRLKKCGKSNVREACPLTCGLCCEDDDTWKFKNKLGLEKSCKWLANKAIRIAKYCDTEVMEICKKSCNNCVDAVPTANPTSPRPTKSPMPSRQPVKRPTPKPSQQPSDSPSVSTMPSKTPSDRPSSRPSKTPTDRPTEVPSQSPSDRPSRSPSESPSDRPSNRPTESTPLPTKSPKPTRSPRPTKSPSQAPSVTCKDDLTEKFEANVGTQKSCEWLANKAIRVARYCNTSEVRSICPVTCNSC